MGDLWDVDVPRDTHGQPMRDPWATHAWTTHGQRMGNPWATHEPPMDTHASFMGRPW